MPTYTLLAQDGEPIDIALRFNVAIDSLLSANSIDVVNDANWRSRWTPGASIQIPGDPLSGANYCERPMSSNPTPLTQLVNEAVPSCPLWNSGGLTAQELWEHWANRDFRAWQLQNGGSPEHPVGRANGHDSPSLWLVHPDYGAQSLGAAPGQGSTTTATQFSDPTEPPRGSPYSELAAPLRQVLVRSFRALKDGTPLAERNLRNAHWGDANRIQRLRTTWQAMDRYGDTDLNTIVKIYQRISNPHRPDAVLQSTWAEVEWIRSAWYGGSLGFFFQPYDTDPLKDVLRRATTLAKDSIGGAAEHEPGGAVARYSTIVFRDSVVDCWREVAVPVGSEGLHFCIPRLDEMETNIHIDWQDPCEGREPDGMCNYDYGVSVPHWIQAMLGHGVPESPFLAGASLIEEIPQIEARVRTAQSAPPAPMSSTPDTTAGTGTLPRRGRGSMLLGLWQVRSRWKQMHRRWAARGYGGWNDARSFLTSARSTAQGVRTLLDEAAVGRAVIQETGI